MNDTNNVFERCNRGDFDNKLPYVGRNDPARAAFDQHQRDLHDEFRKSLFETFDVANHPKRDKVFALAWERGHSAGFYEVANEFADLVDLIKD